MATESKIDIALATVRDIQNHALSGQAALAGESRRTLNNLCCEWSDELGAMSYPPVVRAALRRAGLREVA